MTRFLLLLLFPLTAFADFSGMVVDVHDGDTITVTHDSIETKIRLNQIDAPEIKQAYGIESRDALARYVLHRRVVIKEFGHDKYKRVIGEVYRYGSVNRRMVRYGHAWAYTKYVKDPIYFTLQDRAKARKIGLWKNPNPIEPWIYRKQH